MPRTSKPGKITSTDMENGSAIRAPARQIVQRPASSTRFGPSDDAETRFLFRTFVNRKPDEIKPPKMRIELP